MSEAEAAQSEPREFKAEIKKLLDILIHSVYTSKDVFVRELISNAADALEKVRFKQAAGESLFSPDQPLEIRLETNDEGRVLAITDGGIGMTADEVESNIGTIAHSGATAFLEQLSQSGDGDNQADVNLIGRFGVGFYSVFMAAEKVVLSSRTAYEDGEGVVWTSDGAGTYTLDEAPADLPRGTRIEIHLKEDAKEFVDEAHLKSVIQRYSNFVPFPIFVNDEQVNRTTALWREPASQIKDEEYNEFYKLVSHDYEDPLLRLHHSVDAPLQFKALLFVPQNSPEAMGFGEGDVSLQLYVQRVLIDGDNKYCLPKYLRFVKGVVESEDLPLNVSRETFQHDRMIGKIRDILTRKVLDLFLKLAEDDEEQYNQFWRTFHRILKEGYSDFNHKERFQELLRFNSSRHENDEGLVSLKQYTEAMPEGQKAIYFLTGPSREALDRDPRLELFRKNQVEVLYLYEAADEFVLGSLMKYGEVNLVSADQAKAADLEFGDAADDAKDAEDQEESKSSSIQALVDCFKELLGERVIDVRESQRLVDSPACLVGDDNQMSGHMERMMRMMNKSDDLPQRVLELNAEHPLIQSLVQIHSKDAKDPFLATSCEQLFEGCMLLDGYLTDPHQLVDRMNSVLTNAAEAKM